MIKRWQRNPATVAWNRVVTICRHRRQWDTSLDYRTKRAAEGSYRDLSGQGLVHGGPWVPRSARDDPVKRGRAIDTDQRSIDFTKAADYMEKWDRSIPVAPEVQAGRRALIWAILSVHYTEATADDDVCSPALQVTASEAASASSGDRLPSSLLPLGPRANSKTNKMTTSGSPIARTLPQLPIPPHHPATSTSSTTAQGYSAPDPDAWAAGLEVPDQAPCAGAAPSAAAACLWESAWGFGTPQAVTASQWAPDEYVAWRARWSPDEWSSWQAAGRWSWTEKADSPQDDNPTLTTATRCDSTAELTSPVYHHLALRYLP